MSILNFTETLTQWQGIGDIDAFGNYTIYIPILINCRIIEKVQKIKNKFDEEVISTHIIRCKNEPKIDLLVDLTNNPIFNRQNCRDIKNIETIKNLNNEIEWWKIWL